MTHLINFAGLELSILGPAFSAGLLVLATHVPMGMQVLDRGIVFIDLAIAQIAGIGVIAADVMGWEGALAVQLSALGAALLGAVLLNWTERRWPDIQEALIGVMFVLASCVGILLLAGNPHGGEHLKDLLVGQILWVSTTQIGCVAALTAGVLAIWFGCAQRLGRLAFYALFSVAVTASVQLVGVYLVFATLIVPALATRHLTTRRLPVAYAMGAAAYGVGLVVSAIGDWPSGAVIVIVMALLGVLTSCLVKRLGEAPQSAISHPDNHSNA